MKYVYSCVILMIFFFSSCKRNKETKIKKFNRVSIETLIQDSTLNVRALEIDYNGIVSFAMSNGKIGRISKSEIEEGVNVSFQLKHDSIIPNFRSLAITKSGAFALSIASPALLYKADQDSIKLVYKENHSKVFYDAMEFWNEKEGIAIGDPTDNCMSMIVTRDGGNTWKKLFCDDLPEVVEGEAAFAASDTNIAIVGDSTWVATGGKASRILFSPDKGYHWEVFETPIIQGKETTGMYSIDFYDEYNGFAIGGDYTDPEANTANKIRSSDRGKTWQLVAKNQKPGYRSCVQYVPKSKAKGLVAIGFKGIDYSADAGDTWKHLSDEGFYTLRFLNDSIAYAAGQGRISKLSFAYD